MSDFLAKLIAEGQSILGDAAKVPDREDSIKMDRFDMRDFEEIRANVPAIEKINLELRHKHSYVEQFLQDLYGALYKAVPNLTPQEEMKSSHIGLNAMMSEIMDMPEFKALRQHAQGDEYGTAMAMISFRRTIETALAEAEKMTAELAERAAETEKVLGEDLAEIQQLVGMLQNAPPGDPNGPPSKAELRLQELMDKHNITSIQVIDLRAAIGQAAQQAMQGVRAAMRAAAQQATEELDQEQALASAFGMEDGELQKMPFEERRQLAEKLRNNRLAQFLKLLGQFKNVQQAESRKRVINAETEIHGVTFSDNLARLTPGEMLSFADPTLETLFWQRFVEHNLLTYDVRGKERQGQGPIICVVDESGSMGATDVLGGTREAWSKALALAMLDQASHRSRDFIYIGFSSSHQQVEFRFTRGENHLANVISMTEHFWGGGTNYEEPLSMALNVVQEYDDKGLPKPDIVFISDDAYGAMNEEFMRRWNTVKDKTSLMCYGIAIGCSYSGAMQQVSDNVRSIEEITSDPRAVGDLFRTV